MTVFARLGKEESGLPVIMDAGWKVLATATTGAFLIHFLTYFIAQSAAGILSTPRPDIVVAGILVGIEDSSLQLKALKNIQHHLYALGLYQATAIGLSAFFAQLINKIKTEKNWLASKVDELLTKDKPVVLWTTVAMEFDGKTWLFAGIYEKHINNKAGEPEYIVLQFARRRRLADDGKENAWISIPGESLILHLDGWHSVNLDAMYPLEEQEPDDDIAAQEQPRTPSPAQPA
ncbi:MAG: hypothetical protein KKC01_11440 [Gammaproteobacteria bacterium]|nr:hypothetical protein [Gammaproteobacteria bacterium]